MSTHPWDTNFSPATLGGFQVGEADRPGGGWDSQTVPIDPSSDTLLPLREGTSDLPETLSEKERVSRFVASLQGLQVEPRLREEVTRGLNNPSALAVSGERLYLADLGANKIVSYAVDGNGRLSDSRDEIAGFSQSFRSRSVGRAAVSRGFGRRKNCLLCDWRGGRAADWRARRDYDRFTLLGNLVASNGRIYVADAAIFETNYLVKSYEIGANGTLSSGSAQESEIDFAFQALAISGDRMFVAADRQIASYEINSGALSNPRIISILDNPSALLAADGRLYVADADADKNRLLRD